MISKGKSPEKEEYALVLDYLPYGSSDDRRPSYQKKPLVQAVGENNFVLMDLVPKEGEIPDTQSRVYIGDGDRDVIDHVKHRISYNELGHGAQIELPYVLEISIKKNEDKYVKFFNEAHSITSRLHMLELLPGIGKKLMWAIIDDRKKGEYKSLAEIHERVGGVHSPQKVIANRILEELKDDNIKYRLFTIAPRRPKNQ
jgi:putative nucleotide binding protein